MPKKKTGIRGTLFGEIDPYAIASGGDEVDQLIQIPIETIRPDPGQPRRLLPSEILMAVADGETGPLEAIREWQVVGSDHNLRELRRLADSIAMQGLINPITVRRPSDDERMPNATEYVIVTGERRYWAHVLLATEGRAPLTNGEGQTLIVSRVVPKDTNVRAHQLIENIMREDINAVEKAEGLVALRRELSKVNYSSLSKDNEKLRQDLVPWSTVSEVLGISDRYRIYMTSVLRLPKEGQNIVAEHSLAEMTIRPIVQKLKGNATLQIEALKQVAIWRDESGSEAAPGQAITGAVRELADNLLLQDAIDKSAAETVAQAVEAIKRWPEATRFRSKVRGTLHYLDRLPEDDLVLLARDLALDAHYTGVVDELQDLRKRLDVLLQRVSQYKTASENS